MPKPNKVSQQSGVLLEQAADRYVYRPLDEARRQVRILRLASGRFDQPIKGSPIVLGLDKLRRRKWQQLRQWHALSYVWGVSDRGNVISISRRKLLVTKTLHRALQYLRLSTSVQYMWIDQTCINQDDPVERGSEVRLMRSIYAEATLVVAWLGAPRTEIEDLLSMMGRAGDVLGKSLSGYSQKIGKGEDVSQEKKVLTELLRLRTSDQGFEQVINTLEESLKTFLSEAWFKRVWTLQEAVSASQLFLRTGWTNAPWIEIIDVCLLPGLFTGKGDPHAFTGPMWCINSLLLNVLQPGTPESASWVDVFPFLRRAASDDRDYVYGQLAAFNPKAMDFLTPNYLAGVESVFISGTLAIIKADEHLDTIGTCCAGCKPGKYILPSWCRDWSGGVSGCGIYDDEGTLHGLGLYGAASRYKPRLTEHALDTVVCFRGVIVDEISTAVFKVSMFKAPVDDEEDYVDAYDQLLDFFLPPIGSPTRDDLCQALIRAYLNDTLGGHSRADSAGISQAVTWLHERKRGRGGKIRGAGAEPAKFSAEHMHNRLPGLILDSRSLFETIGHRFGRSCHHIEPGDKVCVLYGGHLPFIIRKAGFVNLEAGNSQPVNTQAYQLIGGECYVDGLVDGEGLEGVAEGDPRVQDICLV
jgi:hypothetical protein